MRITFCLWLMLLNLALAQAYDGGVEKDKASDGSLMYCTQSINNSIEDETGIFLIADNEGVLTISISRGISDGSAFDAFGPTGNELVKLRFSDDEVESIQPDSIEVNVKRGYESATISSNALINKLLSTPNALYVRFEGDERRDFVLSYEVFALAAKGFGKECL